MISIAKELARSTHAIAESGHKRMGALRPGDKRRRLPDKLWLGGRKENKLGLVLNLHLMVRGGR